MKLISTVFMVLMLSMMIPAMESDPLWLRYPAISPSGQEIVFCYQDDLYKVNINGGPAVQLTTHSAHDFMPVWSVDGSTIAFASNRFGNYDIFTISAAGGNITRRTCHSANEYPCSFSPDQQAILFEAHIEDHYQNAQFPSPMLTELYLVAMDNGSIKQILSTPAIKACYSKAMDMLLYQDKKGYEDNWRKKHQSSVTRDIWMYYPATGLHHQLTTFPGEDQSPVFNAANDTVYYLSEQFGSFNVCSFPVADPAKITQHTFFKQHPLRFLSMANDNTLCFGFHGEIYIQKNNSQPKKVSILIQPDQKNNEVEYLQLTTGATELDISPYGDEVVFVLRGDVFVTSVEYNTTKAITNSPGQERSVSFSPDGRSILYASERNDSWNIYQTRIGRPEDLRFTHSTLLIEEPVIENNEETFQPSYSPDGLEVAFLENRETLKVINLQTKQIRTILPQKYNYSYTDGDQHYHWSPDGKWFLVTFLSEGRWSSEAGLVSANGDQKLINLTQNGYEDYSPLWMKDGEMMIWFSDRFGTRSHGGFNIQADVMAMFFSQKAFDEFKLTKEEYELLYPEKKIEEKEKEKKKKDKNKTVEKLSDLKKPVAPIAIDFENIQDRIARLTIHSSWLNNAVISEKGTKLYYLCSFEKGQDLWAHHLKKNETKLLLKLNGSVDDMKMDAEGKNLYVISDGNIIRVRLNKESKEPVTFQAELYLNRNLERSYMFNHLWRQTKRKFYDPDLHGVDWEFYKQAYEIFLPHITNNYDFAEMTSELLGELNASHTGCSYRPKTPLGDETASLGIFYDVAYAGNGLKIKEIIEKNPIIKAGSKIQPEVIIEKINGKPLTSKQILYEQLNHKTGKPVLLDLFLPGKNLRWQEIVKPISYQDENELLYQRWVKSRQAETERLSKGKLGYVHVRSMSGKSFRDVFAEIFGKYNTKAGLVVDSRFNGGGNLVEELTTLLSGKKYLTNSPRKRVIAIEPSNRWTKPSIVLMSESNYSDAHGFPYGYKTLNIGKLVGMPVPGTMTAVWWERLQDQDLRFGIPQVGMVDLNGNYLENQQLSPDYLIENTPHSLIQGQDLQLEKAIEVLLKDLKTES